MLGETRTNALFPVGLEGSLGDLTSAGPGISSCEPPERNRRRASNEEWYRAALAIAKGRSRQVRILAEGCRLALDGGSVKSTLGTSYRGSSLPWNWRRLATLRCCGTEVSEEVFDRWSRECLVPIATWQ
uniref:Uncharacterized protein n=1 Tax=Ditylenchus dipsaci TaxID=166011 RepID=A0A915D212_9BILA